MSVGKRPPRITVEAQSPVIRWEVLSDKFETESHSDSREVLMIVVIDMVNS